ncbi:glutamate-5-semialdehyde dehydrogenase [Helicobacter sp. MIT 14-3879]|uniref:glutamate-5-semialdehyde dehydrogenase n=1 Tax=Helicobacter sp. MIT 14-3879 TaxID=2040649 RepID=UPI000E1F9DA4|nr:glutamate-5-semialdehyde dehydrogenase [Helicobacter sp. MIT 14-3879]
MSKDTLIEMLYKANEAKAIIAKLSDNFRNEVLRAMAEEINNKKELILNANELDINNANLSSSMMDRLRLDDTKIKLISKAICEISQLKSPIGRVIEGWENYRGLKIQKVSTPIGVIAMIYEARANVTSDSAALCFKSGNVCILKGGKEALHSNKAILEALHCVLDKFDLPKSAITFIDSREDTEALLKEDKYIDLVIPRGGEGLIRFVTQNSTIPVIKHDKGVCHLYLHKDCNKDMALKIALNAKIQKPSVCNSIECILIHRECKILEDLIETLSENNVKILAFVENKDIKLSNLVKKFNLELAKESDFYNEYGDNTLNLKIVDSLNDAIYHINKYGSSHSDSIITQDYEVMSRFLDEVDSACVYVNASTRFSDGGEFGFGAEIGISTSKLHSRGPMGIDSLVSYKYKIYGNGDIRE